MTENADRKFKSAVEKVINYTRSYSLNSSTESFVKVDDCCDYKCTYFTISKATAV